MEKERRVNENGGGYDWSPMSSSSSLSKPSSTGINGGTNCILHTVSKLDTLAGVAIKYGVEVRNTKLEI